MIAVHLIEIACRFVIAFVFGDDLCLQSHTLQRGLKVSGAKQNVDGGRGGNEGKNLRRGAADLIAGGAKT